MRRSDPDATIARPSGVKTGEAKSKGPKVRGVLSVALHTSPAGAAYRLKRGPATPRPARACPTGRRRNAPRPPTRPPARHGPPASAGSCRRSAGRATTTPSCRGRRSRTGASGRRATSGATGSRPRPSRSRERRSRRPAPRTPRRAPPGCSRRSRPRRRAARRRATTPPPGRAAPCCAPPPRDRHDPQREVLLLVLGEAPVPPDDQDRRVPRRGVEHEGVLEGQLQRRGLAAREGRLPGHVATLAVGRVVDAQPVRGPARGRPGQPPEQRPVAGDPGRRAGPERPAGEEGGRGRRPRRGRGRARRQADGRWALRRRGPARPRSPTGRRSRTPRPSPRGRTRGPARSGSARRGPSRGSGRPPAPAPWARPRAPRPRAGPRGGWRSSPRRARRPRRPGGPTASRRG